MPEKRTSLFSVAGLSCLSTEPACGLQQWGELLIDIKRRGSEIAPELAIATARSASGRRSFRHRAPTLLGSQSRRDALLWTPEASAHGGRSRAENSFCAIADGGPISASTSASNGPGDPGYRVVGGVRRGRCRRLTVLGTRAHSGIVFRVLSNSTAAPEVLLRAAVAAVSPAVLPGAPALQTLDWELTPAKVPS
jgi:hypothetical protein